MVIGWKVNGYAEHRNQNRCWNSRHCIECLDVETGERASPSNEVRLSELVESKGLDKVQANRWL